MILPLIQVMSSTRLPSQHVTSVIAKAEAQHETCSSFKSDAKSVYSIVCFAADVTSE